MSDESKAQGLPGRDLVVLSGPSGAGKTTVSRAVARRLTLLVSVSATTRRRRMGETEGLDYYFISREEFQKRIAEGRFLEWAEVFDQLYGTPVDEVERARKMGRRLLLEIDVQGGTQVKRKFPEAMAVLLLPPNDQALRRRLSKRGTEAPEEVERRFAKAREEVEKARQSGAYDAEVVNDDLESAIDEVVCIVQGWARKSAAKA
ncbi:MAG TPA: guanylate kinase [Phycisphaerae bacterium]|nr:guanylate kinase [Phycisphaerae bacterium]